MKIRNGFVSNSSSTSFIVTTPNKADTVDITLPVNLSDLGECVKTEQELRNYFSENYEWPERECEYTEDKFNTCLEEIQKGNVVWFGSASSESYESIEQLLYYGSSLDLKVDGGKIIIEDY